jgi:hypothetical protein
MKQKNNIEVLIGGNRYTLGGYESEECLQRIASYINSKIAETEENAGNMMNPTMKNLLVNLNIAEDYFKLKEQYEDLKAEKEENDKLMFELKHKLASISSDMAKKTEADKNQSNASNNMYNNNHYMGKRK